MPTDLDRMFAALSADAGAARLAPAATVRGRADRRLAMQSIAGAAAVAVLVAGAVTGTRLVLTAQDTSPVTPPAQSGPAVPPPSIAPSTSVPPADPPSSTPSKAPPPSGGSAAPAIPKSIPDRAFLQKADWDGDLEGPTRQDNELPGICDTRWASDKQTGVRATRSYVYRDQGLPAEYVPNGTVYQTVTVYRGDGAGAFLDELRSAVPGCADHRLRGSIGAGDDSVLVEIAVPAFDDAGEPVEGENVSYLGVTRVGDAIALVSVRGWESGSAERSAAETFTYGAAERLAAWR